MCRCNFRGQACKTRDLWGSAPNPGGYEPLQLSRTNKHYEGIMGLCPKPRTLFKKKRGKNNVLPPNTPLTLFVRYSAAFSY